jgi:hypothetical protein
VTIRLAVKGGRRKDVFFPGKPAAESHGRKIRKPAGAGIIPASRPVRGGPGAATAVGRGIGRKLW